MFTYCVVDGGLDLRVDIFPESMLLWHDDVDREYEDHFIGVV